MISRVTVIMLLGYDADVSCDDKNADTNISSLKSDFSHKMRMCEKYIFLRINVNHCGFGDKIIILHYFITNEMNVRWHTNIMTFIY